MATVSNYIRARTIRRLARGTLLAASFLVITPTVAAPGPQSHESIRGAVRQFLTEQLRQQHTEAPQITVGRLDSRLRLKSCGKALETFATGTRRLIGPTTVGVRCPTPNPWTIYVPARITVYGDVVVAARPLARGAAVGGNDVRLARKDLSTLPQGYLENPAQVVGKVLRRRLSTNAVIRANQLDRPKLVRRGQQVAIIARIGGIQVRMSGKALSDGAAGDFVKVRNLSSRRIIEGVVVDEGEVRVRL